MACAVDTSLKELGYMEPSIILFMHNLSEHETSGVVIPSPDLRKEKLATFRMHRVKQQTHAPYRIAKPRPIAHTLT
jgi:hypothetical protein